MSHMIFFHLGKIALCRFIATKLIKKIAYVSQRYFEGLKVQKALKEGQ